MDYKADIGVFGGSGFYSFLDDVEAVSYTHLDVYKRQVGHNTKVALRESGCPV